MVAATKDYAKHLVGPPPVPWLQSIALVSSFWGNTFGTDFGVNGAMLVPVASTGAITPQLTIASTAWGASAFILNPVAAAAKARPVFLLIR